MKLATLKHGGRDGTLVVVSRDLQRCIAVPEIAPTLLAALDDWHICAPQLETVYQQLNGDGARASAVRPFLEAACHSPLPRTWQWCDGSAYINHVELVRRARHAEMPASFYSDPLMYQGGSDGFIGPRDAIHADANWGVDFEAEVAVVTGDVKRGTPAELAGQSIRLIMLVNDVSLRHLVPTELAKGFGFFQSKPASAFSPVALTPDELGAAWHDSKVHLPLQVWLNGAPFGAPNAGVDMTFNFAQLIAHAAKTRDLCAGSIIGSGTVSNTQSDLRGSTVANGGVGYCCLAELRTYETIEHGQARTPFMQHGDTVCIKMQDATGQSIFGTIENTVDTQIV